MSRMAYNLTLIKNLCSTEPQPKKLCPIVDSYLRIVLPSVVLLALVVVVASVIFFLISFSICSTDSGSSRASCDKCRSRYGIQTVSATFLRNSSSDKILWFPLSDVESSSSVARRMLLVLRRFRQTSISIANTTGVHVMLLHNCIEIKTLYKKDMCPEFETNPCIIFRRCFGDDVTSSGPSLIPTFNKLQKSSPLPLLVVAAADDDDDDGCVRKGVETPS
mmetsp:Transcript_10379/g.24927  ORF Transcript_10379/g.24927 Transcript_10379/m.24927 type:complete len:220 (-) Transcript_10379:327-986(-)